MDEPASVVAFRQLIVEPVNEFLNASRGFGEPLTAMAYMVKQAFELQLEFIVVGVSSPKPDDLSFSNVTEALSIALREIRDFRDQNRHIDEYSNHLSTVYESVCALSWISVVGSPAQFVREMRDAGDYFGNRVLSTNKGDPRHANWIAKWNEVLKLLELYVRDFHLTGFSWNSVPRQSIPRAPPMPQEFQPDPTTGGNVRSALLTQLYEGPARRPDPMGGGDDRSALLNQLNQGIGITRMLRPVVRRGEGTGDGPVDAAAIQPVAPPPSVASDSEAAPRVYPPKFLLDGRKWRVEHQKDNYSLAIENDDMSQSLAMFKCINTGLEARKKMNGVTIDNCKHSTVVLNDIISSVEVIRCERLKIQCLGHVPLISLDSCDSVQIFLTDRARDVEIIQSKTTSCNVCLLQFDGDYVELPLPEQIRTVVVDRTLQSSVVDKH